MAPSPEILKRNRSRPSDWWMAPDASSTPRRIDEPRSEGGLEGARKIEGNGLIDNGRVVENRSTELQGGVNTELGEALKRGRSSNTEVELLGVNDEALHGEGVVRKRGRPATKGLGEKRAETGREESLRNGPAGVEGLKKRRGRPSLKNLDVENFVEHLATGLEQSKDIEEQAHADAGQGVHTTIGTEAVKKRRGRPPLKNLEGQIVTEGSNTTKGKRTEIVGQLGTNMDQGPSPEKVATQTKKRRRGRPSLNVQHSLDIGQSSNANEVHGKLVGPQAAINTNQEPLLEKPATQGGKQRRGRPPASRQVPEEEPFIEIPAPARTHPTKVRRARRSGAEMLEEESQKISSSLGKTRIRYTRSPVAAAQILSSSISSQPGTATKHKRRSDLDFLEEEMSRISRVPRQERVQTRLRHAESPNSGTQVQNPSSARKHEKSGARPQFPATQTAETVTQKSSERQSQDKGKPRTRRKVAADIEEQPIAGASSKVLVRREKRGHPIEADVSVVTATSKLSKSKKSNTSARVARRSSAEQAPEKSRKRPRVVDADGSATQGRKKHSKNQSQPEIQGRKRKSRDDRDDLRPANEAAKRRRVEREPEPDSEEDIREDLAPYPHLAPVIHRVSHHTIDSKWEPLPAAPIERISQLLQDAQRPVIFRLKDEKKRNQASMAMQTVSRKLIKKFSRGLPFPPAIRKNREDDFDFEKILNVNRALESQLTSTLHANQLLESELSKEMTLLQSEKEKLAMYEENTKREAASRSDAARKLHALLQSEETTEAVDNANANIGVVAKPDFELIEIKIQGDEGLQNLVHDLEGHVATVSGNLKQVHGISQAIAKSKAAVQADLFGHLGTALYEDVVLGVE